MSKDKKPGMMVPANVGRPVRRENAPLAVPDEIEFPESTDLALATEVVDEDREFELALARREMSPLEALQEMSPPQPPLTKGALVNIDEFEAALKSILPLIPTAPCYPALESVKISYAPSESPKLMVEGGGMSHWAAIALDVEARSSMPFTTLLPLQRAVNLLAAVSKLEVKIMVGVDDEGVCLGSHAIPFQAEVSQFPKEPPIFNLEGAEEDAFEEEVSRVAFSGSCWEEISRRVLPACPDGVTPCSKAKPTVLLEFEMEVIDGEPIPVAIAVASDGPRMHILRMTRVFIDDALERMPSRVHLTSRFIEFVEGAGIDWIFLKILRSSLTTSWITAVGESKSRGKKFALASPAEFEDEREEPSALSKWRRYATLSHRMICVGRVDLEQALGECFGEDVTLSVDAMTRRVHVVSEDGAGSSFSRILEAQVVHHGAHGTVDLRTDFARDAVASCPGHLVRIGISSTAGKDPSPVVFEGDDGMFRAVVMSLARGL